MGGTPLALCGDDLQVPLVTGGTRRYANLDFAATTPCLRSVQQAVEDLLPWYSSVNRGAGFPSLIASDALERARSRVAEFTGCRPGDTVVFTQHTTGSLNVLAGVAPAGTKVFAFDLEHHANLLPWRRLDFCVLPTPADRSAVGRVLAEALERAGDGPKLVTVTAASNVTGELWPVAETVAVARRHGARVALDAAQLAAHHPIDLAALDVDYVAFSGHKMYAPFGSGVLAGRSDWLAEATPLLAGGGAVRLVTADDVVWGDLPGRHEAGSPNLLGIVALATACAALEEADLDRVHAREVAIARRLQEGLAGIDGVRSYRVFSPPAPRLGVATFTVDGLPAAVVAAALAAEHGIGVRHGAFCAHPLIQRLNDLAAAETRSLRDRARTGEDVSLPHAVRASIGLSTVEEHIDRLLNAVATLATSGPRWQYRVEGAAAVPDPDPRPRPALPF